MSSASNAIKRPLTYRGRFAPSPSGLLHFGSLVTALASYIHAKQHQGKWLVRIEDIDPPREQIGAADLILKTLETFGLCWDESVFYQSQQYQRYEASLALLAKQKLIYNCQCSRADIKAIGGIYQGHCKNLSLSSAEHAIRLKNSYAINQYHDLIQGLITCDLALAEEDFILKRKDGLYAYQLAVVLDDIAQEISHIIRGCDLLEPTARQLTLFATLKQPAPQYGHIPLAVTSDGYKLSKQNKAPAINLQQPQPTLIAALQFLGQTPPSNLVHESVTEIINWAISNANFELLPKQREIMLENNDIISV